MTAAKTRATEILRFAMPYLESQLPVILVLPEHAVCAIGHVLAENLLGKVDFVQRLADWTAGLIVHDDAVGPYRILARATAGEEVIPRELRPFKSKHRLEDVQAAIVPVPQRIHVESDAVEAHITTLLKDQSGDLSKLSEYVRRVPEIGGQFFREWEHAWSRVGPDRLTIRTYLMDTVDYLRALRTQDFEGFNPQLREAYSSSHWPRSVWISELISRRRMESAEDRKVIGEIISDPTTNRYEPPFLAIHVPGFWIDPRDLQGPPDVYRLQDDRPYSFGSTASYSRSARSL